MSRGHPFKYVGVAVGGPYKGSRMGSPDPVYEVCQMGPNNRWYPGDREILPWVEVDRGRYEWDSGLWWWKGWGKKR
jgi:hypothetical protein